MKKIFSSFLFIACLFLCAEIARACSCVPPRAEFVNDANKYVNHERNRAGAVFSGKVLRIDEVKNSKGKSSGVVRVKFKVYKSWKGAETSNFTISTTNVCCICGFPFEIGKEYLVYASENLRASICSRTKNLADAAEDLEFLGDAKAIDASKKIVVRSKQGNRKS